LAKQAIAIAQHVQLDQAPLCDGHAEARLWRRLISPNGLKCLTN
jgi:hypothetical protein